MTVEPSAIEKNARLAISLMDLTRLNDNDSENDVRALCARAAGPAGSVAAVCIWPRFAALARGLLLKDIGVATVVNFPHGGTDVAQAMEETLAAVQAGAQEIDVVLPYRALGGGRVAEVRAVLDAVRAACPDQILKVIIEVGELGSPELIAAASDLSIDAGANFLKTSTGKTPVSATPETARIMLERIAARGNAAARVGFKVSGGVRTLDDAMIYLQLQAKILGTNSLIRERFRIGASALLDNLEAVLGLDAASSHTSGY